MTPVSGSRRAKVGVFSRKLLRTPGLSVFLEPWGEPVGMVGRGVGELAAIAGWGHRPTASRARKEAARLGLPYLALEDGFLRSAGLGVTGAQPWSLLVDDVGVHYDASTPSRLEALIEAGLEPGPNALELLQLVRAERLTKYNEDAPLHGGSKTSTPSTVYVLDQTRGDISVSAGGAGVETFEAMLDAAITENPGARVLVRTHPDVIAGRRRAYLTELAHRRGVELDSQGANWPEQARRALRVYTVTSLGGFEALVAGAAVSCFGLPFYAGWGLTQDHLASARRRARPSLEQVFAAAYHRYPRYLDPVRGVACDGLITGRRLVAARRRPGRERIVALGLQHWKRPQLLPFLQRAAREVRFQGSERRALGWAAQAGAAVAVWAPREPAGLADRAGGLRLPLLRMEDGFLRSLGLGSDFRQAVSFVLDDVGIYHDTRADSRLERILAETTFTPALLERAARLRGRLVDTGPGKYDLAGVAHDFIPDSRRVVLVPGQVETNGSIRWSAPGLSRNLDLLRAVRAAHPDARILYKPHPEVESGHRPGRVPRADAVAAADMVLDGWSASAALQVADEVHTLTSLLGFEALLRGRKVATYGLPFYAGLGLTQDSLAWPRARRPLVLDALVAAALLLYPLYVDPRTGLPIEAEDAVDLLQQGAPAKMQAVWNAGRLLGWARLVLRG
ncbi:capsular polysaccharide biosynthesis protein [Caulobacter sp. S45]|uniref:capsular polysaccharide biosynthesis protein n=1 Tax=Caulobacter sp. S45 TaxID=1641861 RepID=UPI001576A259|nr:capsular polysaccharide biosynthesis protein [Caulobacter sp. S45]